MAPGLGARLAARRLALGRTQEAVEAGAGLPATALSRYERDGGPVPRVDTLRRLAEALDTTVEALAAAAEHEAAVLPARRVVAYRNGAERRRAAPTCRRGHPRTPGTTCRRCRQLRATQRGAASTPPPSDTPPAMSS